MRTSEIDLTNRPSVVVSGEAAHRWTTITLTLLVLASEALATSLSEANDDYAYVTHRTQQTLTEPRFRHAALRLGDGWIGVFGGFGELTTEIFDPHTETFVLSQTSRWFSDFSGITLPDGRALLVDGMHDAVFDFVEDRFVDLQNTHVAGFTRWPVLTSMPDGRVFVCGGCDVDFEPLGTCGFFDPELMRFELLGELKIPRYYHSVFVLNERYVLICGGYGCDGVVPEERALDTIEIFDVATGQSDYFPARLRTPRHKSSCLKLRDGRILIIGGSCPQRREWDLASTEILDLRTATLSAGPDMALARAFPQGAILPSGRVAVFGGRPDCRAVEVYEPEKDRFSLAGSLMCDARFHGFTTTTLDTGEVLIVGGVINDSGERLDAAEIFLEVGPLDASAPHPLDLPASDPQDEAWCVEIWDGPLLADTVWLTGYDCPDYLPNDPPPHLAAILRATALGEFSHLVVRFASGADYATRVRLFNLVGWTRIPYICLGRNLPAEADGM